jgi:hypothetical protein
VKRHASPASLDAVRSQPEVNTDDDDGFIEGVRVGSVREAVLTNSLTLRLNLSCSPLRPETGRRRAGSQTACLIKAGTFLNIWAVLTLDARIMSASESLCAGLAGPEIDAKRVLKPAHCGGATMEACVQLHACSAVHSSGLSLPDSGPS